MPRHLENHQLKTMLYAVGAISIAHALYRLLKNRPRRICPEDLVEGQVAGVHDISRGMRSENYFAVTVEFRDRNGQKQKYLWQTSRHPSLGETVKLRYSERDPARIEIAETSVPLTRAVIEIVVGIVWIVIAAALG